MGEEERRESSELLLLVLGWGRCSGCERGEKKLLFCFGCVDVMEAALLWFGLGMW